MTNKEVIEILCAYLASQDRLVVERVCANLMLDMHRIFVIESLPDDERNLLLFRIQLNSNELMEGLKKGFNSDLKSINLGKDD